MFCYKEKKRLLLSVVMETKRYHLYFLKKHKLQNIKTKTIITSLKIQIIQPLLASNDENSVNNNQTPDSYWVRSRTYASVNSNKLPLKNSPVSNILLLLFNLFMVNKEK